MARATKLTPETAAKIIGAVRAGSYPATAAQFAGVARQTWSTWKARSASGDPADEPYATLFEDVARAEAEVEVALLATLQKHMRKNPKEILAFLARRNKADWAKQESINVTGQVEHRVGVVLLPPIKELPRTFDVAADRAALPPGDDDAEGDDEG